MTRFLLLVALLSFTQFENQAPDGCSDFALTTEQCAAYETVLAETDGIGGCQGKIGAASKENRYCALQAKFIAYLLQKKVKPAGVARMMQRRQESLYGPVHNFDLTGSPFKGADQPQVTLVEFFDFQCPYCYRLGAVMGEVLNRYPDSVRLYHKMYPLSSHPNSDLAAAAALGAVNSGRYWEMYALLWLVPQPFTAEAIADTARAQGFKRRQVVKDMQDPALLARAMEERAAGRQAGVTVTPTTFINGRKITLPEDVFILSSLIEEALLSQQ